MWRLEACESESKPQNSPKHWKKKDRVEICIDLGLFFNLWVTSRWKKNLLRSALYCNGWLYSHRKQGSEANGKPATEAQFTSTFSNLVFSRNKSATMGCNDGKRKFNLSSFQQDHFENFPMLFSGLNRRLKWSGRRGRSALYCMQCNGCALTQREGAIFSMLVDEDERPLGAHRNPVSSTARS